MLSLNNLLQTMYEYTWIFLWINVFFCIPGNQRVIYFSAVLTPRHLFLLKKSWWLSSVLLVSIKRYLSILSSHTIIYHHQETILHILCLLFSCYLCINVSWVVKKMHITSSKTQRHFFKKLVCLTYSLKPDNIYCNITVYKTGFTRFTQFGYSTTVPLHCIFYPKPKNS